MIAAGRHAITVRKIGTRHTLYTLGDVHMGNKNCAIGEFRRDVAKVRRDPHAFWIGLGDYADYIGPADKRWDPNTITPGIPISALSDWGMYLVKLVRKELWPIRKRCIGLLEGNHEDVYQNRHNQQLHSWLCTEMGVKDLGYSCFLDLVFEKYHSNAHRRYRIFAHHGAGAAQTSGGKANRMERFMLRNEADLYLVGHVHEKDPKRHDVLGADDRCRKLRAVKRLGVYTGSYLRTYGEGRAGYGEKRGYAPVPLGCSTVEFQPFGGGWKHRKDSVTARVVI